MDAYTVAQNTLNSLDFWKGGMGAACQKLNAMPADVQLAMVQILEADAPNLFADMIAATPAESTPTGPQTHTVRHGKGFAYVTGETGDAIEEAGKMSRMYGTAMDVFTDIDGDDVYVCTVDAGTMPDDQVFITFGSNAFAGTGAGDALPF